MITPLFPSHGGISYPKWFGFPIRIQPRCLRILFPVNAFTQHAFFLPVNGRHLSATCMLPEAAAGGALLIQPFAEERKGVLPVFVQTARALAASGIAAMLFDFSGCGDSEGEFATGDPSDFESDCAAALDWLAALCPGLPLFVIGARTGAMLATRLASSCGHVAAAILWAPVDGATKAAGW